MGATGLRVSAGAVSAGIVRACVAVASIACAAVASAADVTTGAPGTAGAVTPNTTAAPNTAPPTGNDAVTSDSAVTATGFTPGGPGTRPNNFFTYGLDAGIGYSDNITETSVDKKSDEILGIGVQLAGLEQSARFQGSVLADLEHVNYLEGTFGPQVIGNFAGYGSYALVPDFLHWVAQDSYGQGLIDPFASQSPGNLEYINSITTGPTFTIPLSTLTMLNVSARYTRVTYQVSPLDNNDYGGSLSLTQLLSARSRISVNVQTQRFDYTDPINPSYDQREAFVRYDVEGARTRIDVDAGYDQIRGDQLNTTGSEVRLNISRTIAVGSVLSLSAGRDPSNSSSFLAQTQGVNGIGLQATSGRQAATPFTNDYQSLAWSFIRRRTTLSFALSHYQEVYDGQSVLDETSSSASVRVSRIVYPGWTVGLIGEYTKQEFSPQLGGNYNQEHGGLNLKWQMARKLALLFEYDHYNRDSDIALFTYSENRIWVKLLYGSEAQNGAAGAGEQAAALSLINTDPFNIPAPAH